MYITFTSREELVLKMKTQIGKNLTRHFLKLGIQLRDALALGLCHLPLSVLLSKVCSQTRIIPPAILSFDFC
jgi:hypothetical protein